MQITTEILDFAWEQIKEFPAAFKSLLESKCYYCILDNKLTLPKVNNNYYITTKQKDSHNIVLNVCKKHKNSLNEDSQFYPLSEKDIFYIKLKGE